MVNHYANNKEVCHLTFLAEKTVPTTSFSLNFKLLICQLKKFALSLQDISTISFELKIIISYDKGRNRK